MRQKAPSRLVAGALAALGAATGARAFEIDTHNPDVTARWDNTVRYNLSVRAEGKDPKIANAPNTDESDNKFGRGDVVNNRIDLLSEFDVVYKGKFGARVSGAAWYDQAYHDQTVKTAPGLEARGSYNNNTYSSFTKRWYNGPSGEILDAFVFGNFDVGSTTLRVKLGQHSIFWGDVTFNANHSVAYSQMPSDSRKTLSSPGIEAKESVLPVNQVSAQLQIADNLAVAAQYFLDWKPNRLPEGGTYYGAADFLFYGPDRFSLSPALAVPRAPAVEPDRKRGNWGVNLKWSPDWLDGTLGVYYRKFDERQPWSAPQVVASPTGFYRLVYARGTQVLGIGINKNIGGLAIAAEVSKRRNTAFINNAINPTTLEGPRGDSTHAFVNATMLGNLSARVPFTAVVEVAASRWDKVRSNENFFNAEGFSGCSPAAAGFACATKTYAGVSALFAPKILQVIPGGDLSIPIFFQMGVKGNAATLSGGNKEAGNYSIGVQLDYLSKYLIGLNYSDFLGRYRDNGTIATVGNGPLYKDRGLLSLTFKTSF